MDEKLVVVAHSMGGNIVYDMLTKRRSDVNVDLLITVGSQVGLFKEMGLYEEDQARGPSPPAGMAGKPPRIRPPRNIRAWLNVFDPLDALAFAAEGVFEGVKDYAVSNGAGPLNAHGLYFVRPHFHERLHVRMSELGLGGAA